MRIRQIAVWAMILCLLAGCRQIEEAKIKDVCRQFISGRIALDRGDTTILKKVSEDSLFRLILLNHQYVQMQQAPVLRADLNIFPVSVKITGNCATCLMSGYEHYEIDLCKYKDSWQVKGENDIYPTKELIQAAEDKIANYKISLRKKPGVDSVLKVVDLFFNNVKRYYLKPDPLFLKTTCNAATISFIKKLFAYSINKIGAEVLTEEMEQENYLVGDVLADKDNATFKFYTEEIWVMLKKIDGKYMITGFNRFSSENISESRMKTNYIDFLRSMKMVRAKLYRNKLIGEKEY